MKLNMEAGSIISYHDCAGLFCGDLEDILHLLLTKAPEAKESVDLLGEMLRQSQAESINELNDLLAVEFRGVSDKSVAVLAEGIETVVESTVLLDVRLHDALLSGQALNTGEEDGFLALVVSMEPGVPQLHVMTE